MLIPPEMPAVDLGCLTPQRPEDTGISADENIWFGWFGRRNPGRRVSKHQQMLPLHRHPNGGMIAAAALMPHVSR